MSTCFRSTVRLVARALVVFGAVLFAADSAHAQVIRPLTDLKTDSLDTRRPSEKFGAYRTGFSIDAAGTTVFAGSTADPFGANPLHATQIVRWTVPGGTASQVGSFNRGVLPTVSVSDDGAWLATISTSDPMSQNHDQSLELFLLSSDGVTIVQLTNDPALNAGSVLSATISGSGNRILFRADTDPLGSNPGRHEQLFIIDTDGTNLTQLTSATGGGAFVGESLSDDGSRIAFSHTGDLTGGNPDERPEIFGVLSDGTQLFQHTSSALDSVDPRIAGNGRRIAFSVEFEEVWAVDWGSSTPTLLAAGSEFSITNDGRFVYYSAGDADNLEIFRIRTDNGSSTQLTFTSPPLENHLPIVSGANVGIVFSVHGGAHPGGSNSDGGTELMVMDATGSNIQQLTNNLVEGFEFEPDVTPDGSRIVFRSSGDLTGTGTVLESEIFRVQSDGLDLTQVTANANATHPTVSSDGSLIVFKSAENLTGQNSCGVPQIFRINADGTGLMQLSTVGGCLVNDFPDVAGDGSFVLFKEGFKLVTVPSSGGAVNVIVDDGASPSAPHLSDNGQWVAYESRTNFDGLNPNLNSQVFRTRTDGTLIERLTANPGFGSARPDIDADGSRVVYFSSADPLGTNPDQNDEIFLFDAPTSTTQQLTVTTSGAAHLPRISGDGEFVYFISSAPFFETLPTERFEYYRLTVSTGLIERAGGLRDRRSGVGGNTVFDRPTLVATSDGRAIVSGRLIATNVNFDQNAQLWFVDFDAPARIRPGKEAPTLVGWDVEPDSVRYDVIRGDLANLQPGGPGEIDLGPVVCIEDDSPDNDTMGSEDATQPDPGQILFYVRRGSRGMLAGPGSYGLASDGSARVPAFGNCQP